MIESGAASIAPWQSVVPVVYQGQRTFAFFHAYADGYQGYVPASAVYTGDGKFSFIGSPLPRGYYRTHERLPQTDFSRLNQTGDNEADLARTRGLFSHNNSSLQESWPSFISVTKPGVCSIELRIKGHLSPGNNLEFPYSDTQELGSVTDVLGWFWQVEIRGWVAGDASKWFIGQRESEVTIGQGIDLIQGDYQPFNVNSKPIIDKPDNPTLKQQPKGQNNFYFIDAPGPLKFGGLVRLKTRTVQNFYTYVERGKNRCGFRWSVTTEIENDRLIRQIVQPNNVPLR